MTVRFPTPGMFGKWFESMRRSGAAWWGPVICVVGCASDPNANDETTATQASGSPSATDAETSGESTAPPGVNTPANPNEAPTTSADATSNASPETSANAPSAVGAGGGDTAGGEDAEPEVQVDPAPVGASTDPSGNGGAAGAAVSAGGSANAGGAGASAGSGGDEGSAAGAPAVGMDGVSPSSGCGVAATPESGRFTIDVDGETREYIIAVPDDYDPEYPYRLVFGWHPLGGSAQQVAGMGLGGGAYYGLEGQAQGTAIFVAPEGLPFNGGNLGWANTGGRDLAFARAMLERFGGELCIDQNRVFSTGFSFGGMMSFAAGCGLGGTVRAIAPMAGNIMVSGCEDGDAPVAVMGFHGTEDTVVAIDGGRAGRDVFVERNNCMASSTPTSPSWCDGLGSSEQPCNCVSYDGCDAGYPVIWCEFNGPHTPAPNSAETIWSFFSQF